MRVIYPIASTVAALALSVTMAQAAPLQPNFDTVSGTDVIQVHNSCHQRIRNHGGYYPNHYHGPGCQMIPTGGGGGPAPAPTHCHGNVQKHWTPGYGNVWHSHGGYNCGVDVYNAAPVPTPGYGGCISVGGVLTVCP